MKGILFRKKRYRQVAEFAERGRNNSMDFMDALLRVLRVLRVKLFVLDKKRPKPLMAEWAFGLIPAGCYFFFFLLIKFTL